MRSSMFASGMAVTMAVALSMPSTLLAHDSSSQRDGGGGSMMGSGMMGMMGQGSRMMDHCSQMMQGASGRPNEQWRDSSPPAGGQDQRNQ